jgi:hypothetical protein
MNGKTITYKGGECSKSIGLFAVNMRDGRSRQSQEQARVLRRDRQRHGRSAVPAGVAVVHAGKSRALFGTVKLKTGLRSGTFSGKVFGSATIISGSFTC